ncbi:hypothetical protein J6590_053454 [Homalodisca vitripennis]|nr:hypothetical protein J6590_053454 [Homalodisca vitripennis]
MRGENGVICDLSPRLTESAKTGIPVADTVISPQRSRCVPINLYYKLLELRIRFHVINTEINSPCGDNHVMFTERWRLDKTQLSLPRNTQILI